MGVLLRLELARLLRSRALVAAGAIWLVAAAGEASVSATPLEG